MRHTPQVITGESANDSGMTCLYLEQRFRAESAEACSLSVFLTKSVSHKGCCKESDFDKIWKKYVE